MENVSSSHETTIVYESSVHQFSLSMTAQPVSGYKIFALFDSESLLPIVSENNKSLKKSDPIRFPFWEMSPRQTKQQALRVTSHRIIDNKQTLDLFYN